jgi:hypothetical protein
MPLPTTAQIVDIELGGKTRQMYFSFRAWKSLEVNPLRPTEVAEFLQGLDAEKAARWVLAGIQGHQALVRRLAEQDGETPPPAEVWDLDRVLDLLDVNAFGAIVTALGAAPEEKAGTEPGNV